MKTNEIESNKLPRRGIVAFLIRRPIAVIVSTLSLVILGIITFQQIPVSLLPDIAVPEITVQVSYPAASARELNQTITKPILNQLQQVNHLADIEAESRDGFAVLKLHFDFGTNINLAYIEANEKIDAIVGSLPRDMQRPQVIKAGAADIPVFNLNVWQSEVTPLPFGEGQGVGASAVTENTPLPVGEGLGVGVGMGMGMGVRPNAPYAHAQLPPPARRPHPRPRASLRAAKP